MGDDFMWNIKNGDVCELKKDLEKDHTLVNTVMNKRFPLHHAADYGQAEVIELLLDQGAKINQTDQFGITPLLAAIYEGHVKCVKLLLSKGADKTGKSPDGTCYLDCCESDNIKQLLK